jgi:hypothetical protein
MRSAIGTGNSPNQLHITVDTGMLPANSIIWKQGSESDGAGFNYHAFAGVKASWEQANSDKKQNYRAFKSFIDARFISTLCDYVEIDRLRYDSISDVELLKLIEARLQPTNSTVYFVRLNSIRIDHTSKDDKGVPHTLSQRYRTFADKFLATVNEAREASTPLNEETIRAAFKSACSTNMLLKMWVSAERWTTVQAIHQRIFRELQTFEASAICTALSTAPSALQTSPQPMPAPIIQPAPAPPPTQQLQPRPVYTPEQRRDHQLQMQQTRFAQQQQQLMLQQQQQQQIIANAVQQSVDSAMQRISSMQPIPATPHIFASQPQALPATVSMNLANFPQQAPSISAQPSQHPGLDARGPNWHVHGQHLACRNTPCGSLSFCQGCGTHGHTSAECRRRTNPAWNASGYYSDRYPGAGPLPYRPSNMQLQQPAPPQPAMPLQQQPLFQQHRIPPPPSYVSPSNPFPTPHKMNNTGRSQLHPAAAPAPPAAAPAPPSPSAHVNVSTQSTDFTSAGGAARS